MKKKAIILGIESSCDETAASVIEENYSSTPKILSKDISLSKQIKFWSGFLTAIPLLLISFNYYFKEYSIYNVAFLLFMFGFVFLATLLDRVFLISYRAHNLSIAIFKTI